MIISANNQNGMGDPARSFALSRTSQAFPFIASGGVESFFPYPGGTYKIHKFTATGELVVQSGTKNVDYIIVGGGGGAGTLGGGGGGGVIVSTPANAVPVKHQTAYPVVVGAGGSGWAGAPSTGQGSSGSSSSFINITMQGGGGGGSVSVPFYFGQSGLPGGSGGGGGVSWPTNPGPFAPPMPPSPVAVMTPRPGGNATNSLYGNGGGSGTAYLQAVSTFIPGPPVPQPPFPRPPRQGGPFPRPPIPGPPIPRWFWTVPAAAGGGGGGAGSIGSSGSVDATAGFGGQGGSGLTLPNMPATTVGGGGGGGGNRNPSLQGGPGNPSSAGAINSGFGGGISSPTSSPFFPRSPFPGGSGIIFVRYNV